MGDSHAWEVIRTSGPLLLADALAVGLSVLTATAIGEWAGVAAGAPASSLALVFGGTSLAFLGFAELYPGVGLSPVVELRRASVATTLAFGSCSVAALAMGAAAAGWPVFVLAWLLTLCSVVGGRPLVRSLLSRLSWWGFRTLVTGDDAAAKHAYQTLLSRRSQGLRPLEPSSATAALSTQPGAAPRVHCAVLATSHGSVTDEASMIRELARRFARVIVLVPDTNELCGALWMRPAQCGTLTGFEVRDGLHSRVNRFVKRSIDLGLVVLASPVLLMLTLVVGVIGKLTSGGPIFYGHPRIGKDGRPSKAWKFRTMVPDADAILERYLEAHPELREEWRRNQKLQDDPRVTRTGRWLRLTSLDELPQLWNVLRGEMSVVGPRPIITDEIARYGEHFELYACVPPGITGLWQVSGRNNTAYGERVALDSFYVRNWSAWLDLYILVRTVPAVLSGEGAS